MANLFFPTCKSYGNIHATNCDFLFSLPLGLVVGVALYYIVVCMYLFGDLTIYAIAAPISVTRVVW